MKEPIKRMTADEARVATFHNIKANVEADLDYVFSYINEAIKEGEYGCRVERVDDFSAVLLERLIALGFKVEWGQSLDGRNETYTDKTKLVISWA